MSKLARLGILILALGALVFTLAPAHAAATIQFNQSDNAIVLGSPVGDPGVDDLGLPPFSVSGVYTLDPETTVADLRVVFVDSLGGTTVEGATDACDEESGNCAWTAVVPFGVFGPATATVTLTDSNEATATASVPLIVV